MKFKKLLVLMVLLSLWGGTMMFADAASQKIKILVNGKELGESGLVIDGTTYLPLRQISGALQSLVTWDETNKKVTINKPNVHMFTSNKDEYTFQEVKKGHAEPFRVAVQVDSLRTEISALKIVLVSPSGKEQLIQSLKVPSQKEAFQLRTELIKYEFDTAGEYAVRLFMKAGSDDWTLMSEKIIMSR